MSNQKRRKTSDNYWTSSEGIDVGVLGGFLLFNSCCLGPTCTWIGVCGAVEFEEFVSGFFLLYCLFFRKNDAKAVTGKQTMWDKQSWGLRFVGCWNVLNGRLDCYFSSSSPILVHYVSEVKNTVPSVFNFLCNCNKMGTYASDTWKTPLGMKVIRIFRLLFRGGALGSRTGSICGALECSSDWLQQWWNAKCAGKS